MKRTLTIIMLLYACKTYSISDTLKKPHSLSVGFSVSDNGQIEKYILDNFYDVNWHQLANFNSAYQSSNGNSIGNEISPWRNYLNWNSRIQYNLLGKEMSFGLHTSYQKRYEAFQNCQIDTFGNSIEQKILRAAFFIQKNYNVKKLTLSPGIELPIFFIGKYTFRERDTYWSPQNPNPPHRIDGTTITPGGFVAALNGTLLIKYDFCTWFSLFTHTSFGISYAQCGGKVKSEYRIYEYSSGTSNSFYGPPYEPRNMKRWFFSAPMVGLGVMVTI